MNIAVRYYSRSGNSKLIAEAIAKAADTAAVSVDSSDAALSEPADVLFIGGALYAYGLDSHMNEYLRTLKKEDVKLAVIFTTTWISKHSITLIRKALTEAGITVCDESFYVRGKPGEKQLSDAGAFAAKFVK